MRIKKNFGEAFRLCILKLSSMPLSRSSPAYLRISQGWRTERLLEKGSHFFSGCFLVAESN